MLTKKVEQIGKAYLPFVSFVFLTYQASLRELINELPFYLLYGHDPRLSKTIVCSKLNMYKKEVAIKCNPVQKHQSYYIAT